MLHIVEFQHRQQFPERMEFLWAQFRRMVKMYEKECGPYTPPTTPFDSIDDYYRR
jgi:hypothetical protein